MRWLLVLAMGCSLVWALVGAMAAQEPEKKVPKVVPVPPLPPRRKYEPPKPPPEPTDPPAQTVTDAKAHVVFHLPPGWNLSRKDGEISTYRLDARTAPRRAQLRAAASLNFNPFPLSTFSGAIFYMSTTPSISPAACAAQTSVKPLVALDPSVISDVKFSRGKDEHGHICTEARDVAYTAMRGGSCVRFDLAVNSFCGGDDSGAQDLTEEQLASLFRRLEGILNTVQFTGK